MFFPNVDAAAGSANIAVAGGAIGTGSVPLVAGGVTFITVVAR